jgi:hypothetical protein
LVVTRAYATGGFGASRRADLPPRRGGSMAPDAVARALALLCADDAAVVTGASIAIDGGVSAGLQSSQWTHLVVDMAAGGPP